MECRRIRQPSEIDRQPVCAGRALPVVELGFARDVDHPSKQLQTFLVRTCRCVRCAERPRRHQPQVRTRALRCGFLRRERGRICIVVAAHVRTGKHRRDQRRNLARDVAGSRVQLRSLDRMRIGRRELAGTDFERGEPAQ
jgi:hypothetical protein